MGDGHFLHPHQAGYIVPVHDPGPLRQRHGGKSLQDRVYLRHKPASFREANEMIDRFINFFNHERIQLKTGEAPFTRRLST